MVLHSMFHNIKRHVSFIEFKLVIKSNSIFHGIGLDCFYDSQC